MSNEEQTRSNGLRSGPVETIKAGLVRGRHDLPVDRYIFDSIDDVLDFDGLQAHAVSWIEDAFRGLPIEDRVAWIPCQVCYYDIYQAHAGNLHLWVTGLTAAVIAVCNAAKAHGIDVTLMHFDRSRDTYIPQRVW